VSTPLLPVAPFWVVKLGASGTTHGPFASQRKADEFAASHGMVASNFVTRVEPVDEVER
jgi:hypothetical protein